MMSLTFEEQFVRDLAEVLDLERLLLRHADNATLALNSSQLDLIQTYLRSKQYQTDALERILKEMHGSEVGHSTLERTFDGEVDLLGDEVWTESSAAFSAIQEAAEVLARQYKKLSFQARMLDLNEAERLLSSAHICETRFRIAMTSYEFHCAQKHPEEASIA